MRRDKLHLKIVHSAPCSQPWSAMSGTSRTRNCEACNKTVFNFDAMSAREIEELASKTNGHFCARVTFRADGSINTLDGQSRPSVAAGLVLAASLSLPAASLGQSMNETPEQPKAHLTGNILRPDSSGPVAGAFIALLSNHQIIASAHSDASGKFDLNAPPGKYDIAFGTDISNTFRIVGYELHGGDQSLNEVPLQAKTTVTVTVESNSTDVATVGELTATVRYRFFWFFFQHPVRYIKNLHHSS
jgi:hypothetical protein